MKHNHSYRDEDAAFARLWREQKRLRREERNGQAKGEGLRAQR